VRERERKGEQLHRQREREREFESESEAERERERHRRRNRKSIADGEREKRERTRGRYRQKETQPIDSNGLCTDVIAFCPSPQSKRSLSGMFLLNSSSRRRVLKGAHAFTGWEKTRKANKIDNSWQSSLARVDICAEEYYPECISKHKRRNAPLHLRCYPSGTVTLSPPNPLTSLNTHMHTLPLCLRNLCEKEGERNSK